MATSSQPSPEQDTTVEDQTQREQLLTQFNSQYHDFITSQNEQIRLAHETSIETPSNATNPNLPQLRVTSTGSARLSLGNGSYVLTATLKCISTPSSKPVTLRYESLNCTDFNAYESWLFYDSSGVVVDHFFPDVEADDSPMPIREENGFVTLNAGEEVVRDVTLPLMFWNGLKAGEEYDLLMPHASIGWWEWGRMDDFEGRRVTRQGVRDDKVVIKIPKSNIIRVKVVEQSTMDCQ